jgi:hypothetical protein
MSSKECSALRRLTVLSCINAPRRFLLSEAMMSFTVELRLPRYVIVGGSALLHCDYNVRKDQLHRVEWLKNGNKLFQYVKGRTPPFRNFSIPGAELDVSSHIIIGIINCIISFLCSYPTEILDDANLF